MPTVRTFTVYRQAIRDDSLTALKNGKGPAIFTDSESALTFLQSQAPNQVSRYCVVDNYGYTLATFGLSVPRTGQACGYPVLSRPFGPVGPTGPQGPRAETGPCPPSLDSERGPYLDSVSAPSEQWKTTGPGRARRRAERKAQGLPNIPQTGPVPPSLPSVKLSSARARKSRAELERMGAIPSRSRDLDTGPVGSDEGPYLDTTGPVRPLASRLNRAPSESAVLRAPSGPLRCELSAPSRPVGPCPTFVDGPDDSGADNGPARLSDGARLLADRLIPIPQRKPGRTRRRNWSYNPR